MNQNLSQSFYLVVSHWAISFVVVPQIWYVLGSSALKSDTNRALSLQEEYNRHLRPNHKGITDNVVVGIRIYSIGPISETEMTMSFDCYFRMKWLDKRLIETAKFLIQEEEEDVENKPSKRKRSPNMYSDSTRKELELLLNSTDYEATPNAASQEGEYTRKVDFVLLGEEYAEAIWSPDMFFPDAVDIRRPGKGILSDSSVLVLHLSGEVFRSMRLQVKSRCKLELTLFPMDVQTCDVCLESYQYHSLDVNASWGGEDLVFLEQDKVRKYGTANFDIVYDHFYWRREVQYNFGYPYVTLCLTIELRRKLSIYLITIYLPSISLVVLSWVGFWIDKRAVPARASLTITTILAQITLITGAANQFPGIADLKLVDLYLIVNFFYVFASLIEFALVSYEPPVKAIGKSWLENTRERMRMMKAKPATEKPVDDNSRPTAVKRKISGLIKPKKTSRDNLDSVTFYNTSLPNETSDGPLSSQRVGVTRNHDTINEQVAQVTYYRDINSPLEECIRITPEPKPALWNESKATSKLLNGAKQPDNPSVKPGLRAKIQRVKLYFKQKNADDVSKIIFPSTFVLWNVVYFGISFSWAERFTFG